MGIRFLNGFLKSNCSPSAIHLVNFGALTGKKVAIDISIYLYKFSAENRLIENIYRMLTAFTHYKITPIFIFDGKPPAEKKFVLQQRQKSKTVAERKYNQLKRQLDGMIISRPFSSQALTAETNQIIQQMEKLKNQFIYINRETISNVKDLLRAYGATYYDSPEEADTLCAMLVHKNKAWACLSDDMDMFAYGATYVLRDFNINDHTASLYSMNIILDDLGLTPAEFKMMCVLSGTDYNSRSADGQHKPNMNIYKCFATLKAFQRNRTNNSTVELNDWINALHKTSEYPDIKSPEMYYNMFDLDHEMHQTKFKLFDNVKIINGKIMQAQVNKILNAHQTNAHAL
jgi:5'-3' exonuclease